MSHKLYIGSIDRRWRRMLRESKSHILVFSPYLTSPTAHSILALVPPARCEVHTVCSIENFSSGASSVRTFRRLLASGFRLFHIDNLHAKLVIVSGVCATVGSQNMTVSGMKNLEASVAIWATEDVQELERSVQAWLEHRRPIDLNEIADIEERVEPLKRKQRFLQRDIAMADGAMQAAREERKRVDEEVKRREEVERKRHEEEKKRRAIERQRTIEQTLAKLDQLLGPGSISKSVAEEFIADSVWWPYHRSGPVRAAGYASRIEGPEGEWRILFGSNYFLVARAIRRCLSEAQSLVRALNNGQTFSKDYLIWSFESIILGAVATSDGIEYSGQ